MNNKLIDYMDDRLSARMRANAIPVIAGVVSELIKSEREDRARAKSTVESQRKKPVYPSLCPNCNGVLSKATLPECQFCGCIVNPIEE